MLTIHLLSTNVRSRSISSCAQRRRRLFKETGSDSLCVLLSYARVPDARLDKFFQICQKLDEQSRISLKNLQFEILISTFRKTYACGRKSLLLTGLHLPPFASLPKPQPQSDRSMSSPARAHSSISHAVGSCPRSARAGESWGWASTGMSRAHMKPGKRAERHARVTHRRASLEPCGFDYNL